MNPMRWHRHAIFWRLSGPYAVRWKKDYRYRNSTAV